LTFASGSTNGTEMCVPVVVNSDTLVESDEDFRVVLALDTGSNLRLGSVETVITITDDDGTSLSVIKMF
jgi:hypothetical protein